MLPRPRNCRRGRKLPTHDCAIGEHGSSRVKNLSFKSKLLVLLSVAALGLLAVGALGLSTLKSIKLDGTLYKEIKMGQDVLADYVPPPEGIAYVVTILVNM